MNINAIKFYVDKRGYKIREFCKMVGITTPTYYKALRDNDIQASTLEKICKLLKISPLEFFDKEGYTLNEQEIIVEDVGVRYSRKPIHMGNLIEKRMDSIGMNAAELGRRCGFTRQAANGILKRQYITMEMAIKINSVLNPPNSEPWDIFEYFRIIKPETLQDKYLRLLEDHAHLLGKTSRIKKSGKP